MRVVVTGAAGFLGSLVAEELLSAGEITIGGVRAELDTLVLTDLIAPSAALSGDGRVVSLVGPLDEIVGRLPDTDLIIHLAAVVSSAAEADLDLGMRVNVDTTRALLDRARSMPVAPVVVFSSSLAVFGHDPFGPALGVIDDDALPRPQSSYGVQKFIGEQLVADYSRKGFIRGRSVRLMTVAIRPGRPNAAASSFVSGIVREPAAGETSICPVDPDTELAISSPERTVSGILQAAASDDARWGSRTAVNLPALTTTPRQMLESLDRIVGAGTSELVSWQPDPGVAAIVGSWPARFESNRARALGLTPPASFDEILASFLARVPRG